MSKRSAIHNVMPRTHRSAPPDRTADLHAVVHHCEAARKLAEDRGERFLAYMIAMAIEESRSLIEQQYGPPVPRPTV